MAGKARAKVVEAMKNSRVKNAAKGAAHSVLGVPFASGASLFGAAQIVAEHPWQTSAAVVGIGSIIDYGSSQNAQIPVGPTSVQARPSSSAGSQYDLGASGDLVFALHRNR